MSILSRFIAFMPAGKSVGSLYTIPRRDKLEKSAR